MHRKIIRWYILRSPWNPKALAEVMAQEQARRQRDGEVPLEYFAPTFTQARNLKGKWVCTSKPLLFKYFFILGSEAAIFKTRAYVPEINFLPRVNAPEGGYHYPYLTERDIHHLRWIARSYDAPIPLFFADPTFLRKGDRVRIVRGPLSGMEATVLSRPRSTQKDILVGLSGQVCVPLLHVGPGDYQILGLHAQGKATYPLLDNSRRFRALYEALCRHHQGASTPQDLSLAEALLQSLEGMDPGTDVMRCKRYTLLLPAYVVAGQEEKARGLAGVMQAILPQVKAPQSRALMYLSLYGCLDSSIYYGLLHQVADPWRAEAEPKPIKRMILDCLEALDKTLGHPHR